MPTALFSITWLTVLNERVYRRGAESHRLPLVSLFSASNHLPEDDALRALFDRFLLRCQVKNLKREAMPSLLRAGWGLETAGPLATVVSAADLAALSLEIPRMELASIMDAYVELVIKIRDLGIAYSDRRAVKVLKLLAASACCAGDAKPNGFRFLGVALCVGPRGADRTAGRVGSMACWNNTPRSRPRIHSLPFTIESMGTSWQSNWTPWISNSMKRT